MSASPPAQVSGRSGQAPPRGRSVLTTAWNAVTAAVGAVMGLLPHLLHHVGPLGGAVLVTGATGSAFAHHR